MSPTPPHRSRRCAIVAGTALTTLLAGGIISGAVPHRERPRHVPGPDSSRPAPGPFGHPSAAARPLYRFWNTGGLMTPESDQARRCSRSRHPVRRLRGQPADRCRRDRCGLRRRDDELGNARLDNARPGLIEGKRAGPAGRPIYTPGWSASTQTVVAGRPRLGQGDHLRLQPGCAAGQATTGEVPKSALPEHVTEARAAGRARLPMRQSNCDRHRRRHARSSTRTAPWT